MDYPIIPKLTPGQRWVPLLVINKLIMISSFSCQGQPIDGPHNGPAPPPWSIPVQQPPPFQATVIFLEIPHTATVKVIARIICMEILA